MDNSDEPVNWIPTSFSSTPEVAEGDSMSSYHSAATPGSAAVDLQSDDQSFDAISRQKLNLTVHTSPKSPRIPGMSMFEDDTRSSWSVEPKPTHLKESSLEDDSRNTTDSQKCIDHILNCVEESVPDVDKELEKAQSDENNDCNVKNSKNKSLKTWNVDTFSCESEEKISDDSDLCKVDSNAIKAETSSDANLGKEKLATDRFDVSSDNQLDAVLITDTSNVDSSDKQVDNNSQFDGPHLDSDSAKLNVDSDSKKEESESVVDELDTKSSFDKLEIEMATERKDTEMKIDELNEGSNLEKLNPEPNIASLDTKTAIETLDTDSSIRKIDTVSNIEKLEKESNVEELDSDSNKELNADSNSKRLDSVPNIESLNADSNIDKLDADSNIEPLDADSNIEPLDADSNIEPIDLNNDKKDNDPIIEKQDSNSLVKKSDTESVQEEGEKISTSIWNVGRLPSEDKEEIMDEDNQNNTDSSKEPEPVIPTESVQKSVWDFKAPEEVKETLMDEDSRLSVNSPEKSESSKRHISSSGVESKSALLALDEESQSSVLSQKSQSSQKSSKRLRFSDDEVNGGAFLPENLFEYMWPQENGEFFILQEQICDYLNVKSFKRKYPNLARRSVDMDEKQFLKEKGVVTEMQCDLGLTALRSDEVLELMSKDYPDHYKDYIKVLREKEQQSITEKHKEFVASNSDKTKMVDLVKKAMKSAAEYNAHLNQERREERRSCMDLQTYTVHYPVKKSQKPKPNTKPSKYPVALLPGQFQDYYKDYTPDELKYLPMNTVLYGPLKELQSTKALSDGSQSDSEDSSASEASCSSSQGTHDDSSSESEKNENGKTPSEKNGTTPVTVYRPKVKPNASCKVCKKGPEDKDGKVVELVHCSECDNSAHPSCIELTMEVVDVLKTYPWQCMDCKICSHCSDPNDEDKMLFCDFCDRGYHTFCVGLKSLPQGKWVCRRCGSCSICGATKPGPETSKAQWLYDSTKGVVELDANRRPKIMCQTCFKKKR